MGEQKKWSDASIQMLRTTQQHHVQLSLMADQKANMLIGATFVVFTLAIAQNQGGPFSVPLLILAIAAFASAALAALAVMPSTIPESTKKTNFLFFGGFSQLDEDEFTDKILARLGDTETVYRTMLRDIHQMGTILAKKKYRYLGWAYRVFLAGITMTFIAFIYERVFGTIM